jgi:steroid delta-isomerase-like uncharacterized protein
MKHNRKICTPNVGPSGTQVVLAADYFKKRGVIPMAVDKEKLVKNWFAAWNSRDPEEISRFYADDGIFDHVPSGKVSHGKDELIATFTGIFIDYPDLRCEQKATFYSPNAVCGEFIMSGTHARSSDPQDPASGKHISVRVGYIVEMQGDKLKRHTDYFDQLTIGQQLGMI